ncbi:MAG: helix-turn-helix transcriptional regulator, partial [Bacteroidales bacterium]|nr:helix-turn-helix transcriptional regulator [Bacteroidales bacterium]
IMALDKKENNTILYQDKSFNCSLAFTLHLIGDKYKSLILYHLKDGPQRSGILQKSITDISNRFITHKRTLQKSALQYSTAIAHSNTNVYF